MDEKIIIPGKRQGERVFWIFQSSFWTVWAIQKIVFYTGKQSLEAITKFTCLRAVIFFALTACFYYFLRLPFLRSQRNIWKWVTVFLAMFLVIACSPLLISFFTEHLGMRISRSNSAGAWRGLTILSLWFALYFGTIFLEGLYKAQMKARDAVAASRESELKQLQAQLNPHFLFNALNTLLSKEQNPEALQMTQHLANFLRSSLTKSYALERLEVELDSLEDYLAIQRTRFGENLECSIDCEMAARSVLAPPMMIQPLLENAFKYGPKTSAMPLRVEVKARLIHDRDERSLLVSVANTGQWFHDSQVGSQSLGTGLANLRKRLSLLLGEEASLTIKREPAWVTVEIRIPISPAPSNLKGAA
jgi:sensor histidine kinase YesM